MKAEVCKNCTYCRPINKTKGECEHPKIEDYVTMLYSYCELFEKRSDVTFYTVTVAVNQRHEIVVDRNPMDIEDCELLQYCDNTTEVFEEATLQTYEKFKEQLWNSKLLNFQNLT